MIAFSVLLSKNKKRHLPSYGQQRKKLSTLTTKPPPLFLDDRGNGRLTQQKTNRQSHGARSQRKKKNCLRNKKNKNNLKRRNPMSPR
jgi:hypothetical protein